MDDSLSPAEARARMLEAVVGEPVDRDRFHGDDPVIGYEVDLAGESALMRQLEDLRGVLWDGERDGERSAQDWLLLTAVLRVHPERQPRRVVAADAVEVGLLEVVARYRAAGEEWPDHLQRAGRWHPGSAGGVVAGLRRGARSDRPGCGLVAGGVAGRVGRDGGRRMGPCCEFVWGPRGRAGNPAASGVAAGG